MRARRDSCLKPVRRILLLLLAALACGGVSSAQDPEEPSGRWSLEVFDGFAGLNPADFNLLADSDEGLRAFLYDDLLQDLTARGEILSWNSQSDNDFPRIRWALPFGARLRFRVLGGLSLSVGFRRISLDRSADPSFVTTRELDTNYSQQEAVTYGEYTLAVAGSIPQIGIHLRVVRRGDFGLEIYTLGGPLYADCRFTRDRIYNWNETRQGNTYTVFESRSRLDEEGEGVGLAVEAGLRLNLRLYGRLSGFFEGGWAYQVVESLSGPGQETRSGETVSWEGEWEVREEVLQMPWGEYRYRFPSNLQPRPFTTVSSDPFSLDLSGLQLRLGLAFRF